MVLGGAEEIGANCTYLQLDGTGVLIDAGLHPRNRDGAAFPDLESLEMRPVDLVAITHAHTDHLAGLPYVVRRYPQVRTLMSFATRDLSHIMLNNSSKLLRTDVGKSFTKEQLEYYHPDQIELLRRTFEAIPYEEKTSFKGYSGAHEVDLTFHWAGHILGSAGVSLECNGLRIMHTGDVQFDAQPFIKKARFPKIHADVLITEATNCATDRPNDFTGESKKLAAFINKISVAGGSILVPCFALGKQQEMLTKLHELMLKGSIPRLPIFTGGMGVKINKVYDQYCYTDPVKVPGFEVSDIPQERLRFGDLFTGAYMKHPSIVLAPSGMMNKGTLSYALATQWVTRPSFGMAFIGYQDPDSPGHHMLYSKPNVAFDFGGRKLTRSCHLERLRFSAHASLEGIVDYITDVRPSTLVIVHGETEACDLLALCVRERLPGTRVIIPRQGVSYDIASTKH